MHSGLFYINLAHFSGNFRELEGGENGQKLVQKGTKRAKKGIKIKEVCISNLLKCLKMSQICAKEHIVHEE